VSYIVWLIASPPLLWLIKPAICHHLLPSWFLSFAYIAPWGLHTLHLSLKADSDINDAILSFEWDVDPDAVATDMSKVLAAEPEPAIIVNNPSQPQSRRNGP
jgi:hypothetical protein